MEHDHPFDLLANEAILPVQFYHARRDLEPERRLALAVLNDAISLAQRGYPPEAKKNARAAYLEALNWLYGAGTGIFSMDGVCNLVWPDYPDMAALLRARLRDWDGQLGKRSPVFAGRQRPVANRVRR